MTLPPRRIRPRFWGPRPAEQVEDELAFHVEMRVRDAVARGLSEADARAAVARRFGDLAAIRASCVESTTRRERRLTRALLVDAVKQDVRFGVRSLRRQPRWTAVAALTLALGIGANVAIFSAADAVLFRPLPFPRPDELVTTWAVSAADVVASQSRVPGFRSAAAYAETGMNLADSEGALRVGGAEISANLFSTLGARPLLGRDLSPDADHPGATPQMLLGERLWRDRYAADPVIVGRTLSVDGVQRVVTGIIPESATFPTTGVQLWVPATFDPAQRGAYWAWWKYRTIARLKPGVSLAQATAEARLLAGQLRHENPIWDPGPGFADNATVRPLQADRARPARTMLVILLGVAGFLLLVTCANVANLSLARTIAREREFTIRAALGSGAMRITRQLLTESILLAALGAASAVALSWFGLQLLRGALPPELSRLAPIVVNGRVLGYAAGIAIASALLFGLVPALRASRVAPDAALTSGARGGTAGARHRRLASSLVVGELAIAATLVLGAGLLLRSLDALQRLDPGFRSEHVMTARVTLSPQEYLDPTRQVAFFTTLLDRVRVAPGVAAAAAVSVPPLRGGSYASALRVEGQFEDLHHALPMADHFVVVTPGYFETMRIPIVRGRALTAADGAGAVPVAIVSASMAHHFWPGVDPVGKRIGRPYKDPWITVIGVAADVQQDSLSGTGEMIWYQPFAQLPQTDMTIVARTAGEPAALASTLRSAVAALDRSTPVSDVRPMPDIVSESVARARFLTLLVSVFALLALTLGAVGVYGVVATLVAQRTRELGVRLALGATPADILRLVLRHSAALGLGGVGIGVLLALALTRVLRRLLYGVSTTDPATFIIVSLVLLAATLAAAIAPAVRAMRTDPIAAIKAD